MSLKVVYKTEYVSSWSQAKALEQVMKDLNSRFGRGTVMQLGNAEPQKM